MLSLSPRVRIFAAVEPVDFRKGFDRLVQVVRDECQGTRIVTQLGDVNRYAPSVWLGWSQGCLG